MSHEAFLQTIRENPDDDTPRLVYADWLDEHGEPARAEFVRVQCELAHLTDDDPSHRGLKERESAILRANWERWIGPIRREFGASIPSEHVRDHYFRRGFIVSLWLDAEVFVTRADELFRTVPFTGVSLRRVGPWAGELAACPWLIGLDSLEFREHYVDPLDTSGAVALAASPHLKRLRMLWLVSQNIGDVGLRALATAPWMAGVTSHGCYECGISDEGAIALAESEKLTELRHLSLRNNRIGEEGARSLLSSPHLRRLESLDLGQNALLASASELKKSARLPNLVSFNVHSYPPRY